jgi:tartrate dehydrogenase/decarboxylase/D-malate dehydrogenase
MLEFFGYQKWADRLIEIIEEMLVEKKVLTPDLGGNAKTSQVGDEVVQKLKEKAV